MSKIQISGFRLSTLLFLFSILLFIFAITIILIFSAEGLRFDSFGNVKDTGVIRLHTTPDDVDAYINGKEVDVSNNMIEGIDPGSVSLMLSKEGYLEWEKTVKVDSDVVKEVFAQLLPEKMNFSRITNTNVDSIYFSEDPDYVFYTVLDFEQDEDVGIWKYKLTESTLSISDNKPEKIVALSKTMASRLQDQEYYIKVSPDNNRFIFVSKNLDMLYIYNSKNDGERIDLVNKLGYMPNRVDWYKNSESLVIHHDDLLFEYSISLGEMYIINYIPSVDPIYSVTRNVVYYVSQGHIYVYQGQGAYRLTFEENFELPANINSLFTSYNSENILILSSENGIFFVGIDKPFLSLISSKASPVAISRDSLTLLFEENGEFYTQLFEETVDGKSYEVSRRKVGTFEGELMNFTYAANGKNLLVFEASEDDQFDLWVLDYDGSNAKKITNGNKLYGNVTQMSEDGTEMYLLLRDNPENEMNKVLNNIYMLDLKVD